MKKEASDNRQWFTGKSHNERLGLSYFGARWYDPSTGRFISPDPVDRIDRYTEHAFNRYAYANNNPYKYVDPDGKDVYGINFGGSGTKLIKTSISIQVLFDTQGNFGIQKTDEVGRGLGSSAGVFLTAVYGTPDTIYDLEGEGISISGSAGRFGGAVSIPISHDYTENGENQNLKFEESGVVTEVGLSRSIGKGEVGITGTYTKTLYSTAILGDVGRSLGKGLYDITH